MLIEVTNPGVTNVANEAYPAVPGTSQGLPVPSSVAVADSAARPASFSLGAATPATPTTNVASQNLASSNPVEILVSPVGNFQTNNTLGDLRSFTVSSTQTIDSGLPTEAYKVTLAAGTDLYSYGLDLTGMLAYFPSTASALSPENIPSRPIFAYGKNFVMVYRYDVFGNSMSAPGTGAAQCRIAILRDGDEVLNQLVGSEVDVTISPAPPVAQTVPAVGGRTQGNIAANPGVVVPFVGSGVQLPPLLGTFEVEDQVPIGSGLPVNVFVP